MREFFSIRAPRAWQSPPQAPAHCPAANQAHHRELCRVLRTALESPGKAEDTAQLQCRFLPKSRALGSVFPQRQHQGEQDIFKTGSQQLTPKLAACGGVHKVKDGAAGSVCKHNGPCASTDSSCAGARLQPGRLLPLLLTRDKCMSSIPSRLVCYLTLISAGLGKAVSPHCPFVD